MKRIFSIVCLLSIYISFNSCKDEQKETVQTAEIEQEIDLGDITYEDSRTSEILKDYLNLKNTLVKSDVNAVKIASKELSSNFPNDPRNALKSFSVQISNSDDLEIQRSLFSELNVHIEKVFKFRMTDGKLYKQYCPMASDNKGANWFSTSEEIRNPYFGDKMLKCGKVTDTIQKKLL